ncbi:vacuolar-sorting protein SNF8-like [Mizuhopecten yessoensis]|uniref:vacuolar-sorting protein SNF8-like n=1 Tax=Mizuhopecten yessoensis TaxID=6573 RepID=UPI000B45A8BD|nr:vacuolar-sorting protein SNF8-like [Mizuhopecten yessoensis]
MHRRGHGIGAIKKKDLAQARYKDKGSEIAEDQVSQMAKQMEKFKEHLEDFAVNHKEDIKKDPEFRVQFQNMCASIGVDPLASSKGFWAEMLGVGDFYYEIGVQIIEVCIATSHRNGATNHRNGGKSL